MPTLSNPNMERFYFQSIIKDEKRLRARYWTLVKQDWLLGLLLIYYRDLWPFRQNSRLSENQCQEA